MASWRRKSNMDLFRWIDFWIGNAIKGHPLHSSFKGYTFLLYWYPLLFPLTLRYVLESTLGGLSVRGKAKFPLLFPLTLRYVLRTTQCPWKIKKSSPPDPLFCQWFFNYLQKKNATQFGVETETFKIYRRSLVEVFTGTPCFWCMFKAQVKRTENWACADWGNERQ